MEEETPESMKYIMNNKNSINKFIRKTCKPRLFSEIMFVSKIKESSYLSKFSFLLKYLYF